MMDQAQRYKYEVLAACQKVHMACTGAGDGLSLEDAVSYFEFLAFRLMTWQPSARGQAKYDNSVKTLVSVSYDDIKDYIDRLKKSQEQLITDLRTGRL